MRTIKRWVAISVVLLVIGSVGVASAQSAARGRSDSSGGTYVLHLQSNVPGATIEINGQYYGKAPMNIQLQAGYYNIRVSAPAYRDFSTTINVSRTMTLNANLQPMNFSLTVTSNVNGAEVFLNGRRMGQAPLHTTLAPGTYELRVQAGGYEVFTAQVNVNRNTSIHAQLQGRLAMLHIVIPDQFLNANSEHGRGDRRRAENDVRVFIDNREVNRENLRVRQGNHTIRFESGSFMVQQSFYFYGGRDYTISPELTIKIQQ